MSGRFNDSDRVSVNYAKIIKKADKIGFTLAEVSRKIGKSSGYLSAMSAGSNKMTYKDLKHIAWILNIHGATKLVVEESVHVEADGDVLKDMMANTPTDERIATALEDIASMLRILVSCGMEANDHGKD